MARMSAASWVGPTANRTAGGMTEVHGLVLHIQQGYEGGSIAWFKDPASRASSHFLNPKAGPLQQLIDTADRAWAQAAGNPYWISVENEGFVPDALTASQLENVAQLLAWLHHVYAVPLLATNDVNGHGLAWHGMGYAAWGGHPDCPGDAIVRQRPAIITRAKEIVGTQVPSVSLSRLVDAAYRDPGLPQGGTTHAADVRPVEHALRAEGLLAAAYASDGSFGTMTRAAYRRWQESPLGGSFRGSDADGIPGRVSLQHLADRHGFAVTT